MSSQRKSDAARTNGAKSHGPITPEGQAKSSQNSTTHGLGAKSIVLPGESNEEYQFLLDGYVDQFDPQGVVELELVENMAAAQWRLRRIRSIETELLSTELVRRAEDIDAEFSGMAPDDRVAWVFQKLADHGQTLALLVRYEGTISRSHDRAFKQLRLLQSARNPPQPNEPKPPSADPAAPPDSPSRQTPPHPQAQLSGFCGASTSKPTGRHVCEGIREADHQMSDVQDAARNGGMAGREAHWR